MSDQIVETRLEGLLRQSLKAEVASLPMRVTADQVMDRVIARGARAGFLERVLLNRFALQLGAVTVMVVVALGVGIWVSRPSVVGPPPPSSSASASPLSPTIRPEVVHGWPGRRPGGSPAGLYSWVSWYGTNPLHQSWMHNGDVEINMADAPASACLGGVTEVTVAGYSATHKRIDPQLHDWAIDLGMDNHIDFEWAEEWIVDFPERCLVIHLTARPGTSQADLGEAQDIIESLTYEPRDPPLTGFRLIFRLTTDDWDSG